MPLDRQTPKTSQTFQSVYVSNAAPLDNKMMFQNVDLFNSMPNKSKWHGMLVFIVSLNAWHTYDKPTNKLIEFSTALIVPNGVRLIWKYPGNLNNSILEHNDIIEGFIENRFMKARYISGDANLVSSYIIVEEHILE